MQERNFPFIPVFVEHVIKEITQLGDMNVNGAGIQLLHIFQPADKGADLLPGYGRKWAIWKLVLGPFDVGLEVGNVSGDRTGARSRKERISLCFSIKVVLISSMKWPSCKEIRQ